MGRRIERVVITILGMIAVVALDTCYQLSDLVFWGLEATLLFICGIFVYRAII